MTKKWTYPKRSGRPSVGSAIVALIERMDHENETWGYQRIQGELRKIGYRVGIHDPQDPQAAADTTGSAASDRHVLAPLPASAQASSMLAVDFFHVDCV